MPRKKARFFWKKGGGLKEGHCTWSLRKNFKLRSGLVLLSCSPAVPSTDDEMKLQDVAFPDETIPVFPSVWLKEGRLRMENARAGAKGSF